MKWNTTPLPDRDLSASVTIATTCNHCGTEYKADRPIYIDVELNQNYASLAASGRLLGTACPNCGTVKECTLPLLWITRSLRPHVILCTEALQSPDTSHNMQWLVSNLANALDGLPTDWKGDKLQAIDLRLLPYLLERLADPEPHHWIAAIQWKLILAAQLPRGDLSTLGELVGLHPELLWAPADNVLRRMLKGAAARHDSHSEARFSGTDNLLSILRAANGINLLAADAN